MDVVTTSLEALIQRVTNPQNQKTDVAATEAFCVMVTKETEGVQIGTKLLALHIQSSNEAEALQALALLDTCMRRCGSSFHAEVGKFRFLNEMIRLVSPKYLGGRTPAPVRQKVLQLLHLWTKEYPRETKIKEAFEMLRKQGVVEEDSASILEAGENGLKSPKTRNTIFEDEEKSKLLQKLLQSKNPDDLQAANRLIKTMVREDERRLQQNSRRIMELESVHNNAKLLSDMLDTYTRNETNAEDLELMKELHQACERLKPTILRLADETQDNKDMLGDVLAASDELNQVFDKYAAIIVRGETIDVGSKEESNATSSLLDLSTPSENISPDNPPVDNLYDGASNESRTDMEVLGDIFGSLEKSAGTFNVSTTSVLLPNTAIMQPISVAPSRKRDENAGTPEKRIDSKARALEELNELGESLLKQSLSSRITNTRSSREPVRQGSKLESLEDGYSWTSPTVTQQSGPPPPDPTGPDKDSDKQSPRTNSTKDSTSRQENQTNTASDAAPIATEPEIKPLTDLNISLQDIKPGTIPPMTVIDEKNGISVILHFARDRPRPDVFVVVITTMSKNANPLTNYLFQAVVPKRCKCRLQPPSGTELPAHNPFLPPSAITQIMLVANPNKEPVSLKFMLSYTMDDETYTEMGEVEELPQPVVDQL